MANIKVIVGVLVVLQVKTCYSDYSALFPYGPAHTDAEVPDKQNVNFALQLDLPNEGVVFYGRRHRKLALSNHGAFYFTEELPAYHVGARPPTFNSPPFAAPLYFDAMFLSDNPVGRVYYRYVERSLQYPTLTDLSTLVKERVVGSRSFNATFGVIATWENMTDSKSVHQCTSTGTEGACADIPRNTFQAVLLGDRYSTFVIFNYAQVVERPQDAKAGIFAGDNIGWTPVLTNSQQRIADIENLYGTSDVRGRFLFKVNENRVIRGGCTRSRVSAPLAAYPNHAGMYGGEVIEVSGPCLDQQSVVRCRFGDTTVTGRRINDNKAACSVPMLTERGEISLAMSASTSDNFNYVSNFTIVFPGRLSADVKTDYLGPDQGWNETDASSLTLHWESDLLSRDPAAVIQVNLVGYREDDTQGHWTTLVNIADQIPNRKGKPSNFGQETGVTFNPADFRCTADQCEQYELGLIEVKLIQGQPNTHSSLYSHNKPLGWFVTEAMEQKHGHDWPSALCTLWDEKDKQDSDWLEELLNCPCTMNQAMADFGRWQPDVGCNIFTGSKCTYHQGAVHCVRSVQPTASGAGNQCCYSADGNLKYAADSFQGSTPDKGHAWGAAPYNKPGYVPDQSHWIDDVVSFYYCCLWTEYHDCDKYMDRRPTRDCLNYSPPGTAMAFGDPHIYTFDEVSYRFHGRGDFTLVQAGSFILQGRFVESPTQSPLNFNVSILTSIAVKDMGKSDTVEIQLASRDDVEFRQLIAYVNNQNLNFSSNGMHWQDFTGVSVVTQDQRKQDNITILFASGIGVQVASTHGLLNLIVSLPPQLKNGESRGLLGVWDGDKAREFIPRNQADPIASMSSSEQIYRQFALSWAVDETDSLFGDPEKHDPTFVPTFVNPTGVPPAGIQSVCEGNRMCEYDYRVTGESAIGRSTFIAAMWYSTLQTFLQPVDTCGLLDVPYSEKDSYDYTAGSTVIMTGCRSGSLHGETTYTCNGESKQWEPHVTASCTGEAEQAGLGMKLAIGLGVVGGAAVLVVIIIIIVRCRGCKKSAKKGSDETEMRTGPKVPGRSEYAPARTSEDIEDVRPVVKPRSKERAEDNSV